MKYWIGLKFGIHDIYIILHMYVEFYVNRTPDHRHTLTRSNSVRFAKITRKIPQKNQKNPTVLFTIHRLNQKNPTDKKQKKNRLC